MKKTIFIQNKSQIQDCEITVDSSSIQSIIQTETSSPILQDIFQKFHDFLLEDDALTNSNAIYTLIKYSKNDLLEQDVIQQLLQSLYIGEKSLYSVLKKQGLEDNRFDYRNYQYSSAFNEAIMKQVKRIDKNNLKNFQSMYYQFDLEYSEEDVLGYKKRMVKQLPFIRR